MPNIVLYGERIAVIPIYETSSKGGIALPQNTKRHNRSEVLRGRVAFVSDDTSLDQNNVPIRHVPRIVGKNVHYYAGQVFEVTVNGQTYHIVDMGTLLCVEDTSGNSGADI